MTPGTIHDPEKERRQIRYSLAVGLTVMALFLAADALWKLSARPSNKLYNILATLHERLSPPPAGLHDIVLVGIDSETAAQMKERWPYSRKTFATVIEQLQGAGAKAVGLDFSFFGGSSTPEEDEMLRQSLASDRVVLGAVFSENGGVVWSTLPGLTAVPRSGIVNKLQDDDGIIRHALTYLISANPAFPNARLFSWELKLLNASRAINLASLEDQGRTLSLKSPTGEIRIPVDGASKTFPVRFRAHTEDFTRLSFHNVLDGRFDPQLVKDKVVMIGFLSLLFQDVHQTPIGWLPGLTLNANTFLTIYDRDFIRQVPLGIELLLLALGLSAAILCMRRMPLACASGWIAVGLAGFLVLSYALYAWGWTWNYVRLPASLVVIPWLVQWSAYRRQRVLQRRVQALFVNAR